LKLDELRGLLESLNNFFFNLPSQMRSQEQKDRNRLIMLLADLQRDPDALGEYALKLSEWMMEYLG